jgi:hypothetical protein
MARQYEIIGPIPPIISSGKNKPMRTATVSNAASAAETRNLWLAMIVIAMGQASMSFKRRPGRN